VPSTSAWIIDRLTLSNAETAEEMALAGKPSTSSTTMEKIKTSGAG
jgi:hypothetical protein